MGVTSIPWPGVCTGWPHLPFTSSFPPWILTAAWICDVGKVQRLCCVFWGIRLEKQRCCIKITIRLLRKSQSEWASVQMIKGTFMQVQRNSRCPPSPACTVNKQQKLSIARTALLPSLCSEGTYSSPALVSGCGNSGELPKGGCMSTLQLIYSVGQISPTTHSLTASKNSPRVPMMTTCPTETEKKFQPLPLLLLWNLEHWRHMRW